VTAAAGSGTADPADPAARRAVVRQALSVGVATGAYGLSFGALAVAAGLDAWQAMALSLLMFTGGSQFAFVGIIANGLHAAPAAIAASSHLTIDESTAVAVAQDDARTSRLGFWVTGLTVFALWNLTTLVGTVLGSHIGDPRTYGLEAAACAAFTALLWPRLRDRDAVAIAVAGAVLAIVLSPTMPPGIPVVAAAAASLLAWRAPRREAP
jgi:predicted branched-subunit amino acid permease